MYKLLIVTFRPVTWVIAPAVTKEQIKRWIKMGCVDKNFIHVDRAFPRDNECRPLMLKLWFEAPLRRAIRRLQYDHSIAIDWDILDDDNIPVNYVVIPEKPLVYKRAIHKLDDQGNVVDSRLEVFEYIDSTYTLRFKIRVPAQNLNKFIEAFKLAGKLGIQAKTKKGYGRFTVEFTEIKPNIPGITAIKHFPQVKPKPK